MSSQKIPSNKLPGPCFAIYVDGTGQWVNSLEPLGAVSTDSTIDQALACVRATRVIKQMGQNLDDKTKLVNSLQNHLGILETRINKLEQAQQQFELLETKQSTQIVGLGALGYRVCKLERVQQIQYQHNRVLEARVGKLAKLMEVSISTINRLNTEIQILQTQLEIFKSDRRDMISPERADEHSEQTTTGCVTTERPKLSSTPANDLTESRGESNDLVESHDDMSGITFLVSTPLIIGLTWVAFCGMSIMETIAIFILLITIVPLMVNTMMRSNF